MKKRTKIIIITAMVLLLGLTGYLNVVLNNSVKNKNVTPTTTTSYFATYRLDREATRDQEMLYYDAIITSASSEDAVKKAEEEKLALVKKMEQELVVEGLIKAKGFTDCIVTITDEKVNTIVKSVKLTKTEVAQIVSVIQGQLGSNIENIKIIPIE